MSVVHFCYKKGPRVLHGRCPGLSRRSSPLLCEFYCESPLFPSKRQHGPGLCTFIVFLTKEKLSHIIPYFLCNTYNVRSSFLLQKNTVQEYCTEDVRDCQEDPHHCFMSSTVNLLCFQTNATFDYSFFFDHFHSVDHPKIHSCTQYST